MSIYCRSSTHQRSVSIPSGVSLDGSNNCTNFTLDDINFLVQHSFDLRKTNVERVQITQSVYIISDTNAVIRLDNHIFVPITQEDI